MKKQNETKDGVDAGKPSEDELAVNPPVAPVENYDPGKADGKRRIFGNGDTDREDLEP